MAKMTGAQITIESLLAEGVDTIFGYPGGAILPTYDALVQNPALRHILVRHEQGAAHMAEGYARVSGRPGVVPSDQVGIGFWRRDHCADHQPE